MMAQGFDVRVVENGKRLDRYLQREPYDLLVLDWMMEPEDGLSVCKRLRAEGQTLPILMACVISVGSPAAIFCRLSRARPRATSSCGRNGLAR